ncbi:MAG: transglutaminase domain-containing protein [Pirellulales bacterium]|nr:transglutaminase domain-containing protein [Pirellulales bacterium]
MRHALIGVVLGLAAWASPVWAQFKEGDAGGATLGESQTQRWKAGMIVTASGGTCRGMVGYVPVPVEWPEQKVALVDEDVSPAAKIGYETVAGNPKLMVIRIGSLPDGQTANALVTFEITRHAQLPPDEDKTGEYVLPNPKKLPVDVRMFLNANPYIESRSPKIRALAREIGVKEETAWKQVEAVYDWVRDNIEYKNGDLKTAVAALRDRTGDCEELTSLFIAILRAKDIPARTVWVPGHCYPEFYLEDKEGRGHWFPCQAAGTRSFGGIPELRPILQKGDWFRLPDNRREFVRYLPERVTGAATGGKPQVKFVREVVGQ